MLFLFLITWGNVSGWWLLPCVLAGVAYAWLLYSNPVLPGKSYQIALAALRGLSITIICLLLAGPLLHTTTYQAHKPLILVAEDNSASVDLFKPSGYRPQLLDNALTRLQQQLGGDYEVRRFHFDKQLYNGPSRKPVGAHTNISAALQELYERHADQNTGAVILATDGLYNAGTEPLYAAQQFRAAVYTIGLGDTTVRRDARISNINYNQTAVLGNDFTVELQAEANGCAGEKLRLTVTQDGREVYSQPIPVTATDFHRLIPLKLYANDKGIHRFTFTLSKLSNEVIYANNTQTVYIEILDARQKILLVYASPHPDISTIKQAIALNKNYDVKAIPAAEANRIQPADYDLAILYQTTLNSNPALQQAINNRTPVWYILGTQSDIAAFNSEQSLLKINSAQTSFQETFASPVSQFSTFKISDSTLKRIITLPPFLVPYGSYTVSADAQILLKQKIGNVTTATPLLLFSKAGSRPVAVLSGEGLWRWQLAEQAAYGNPHATQELIQQSVLFMTSDARRQRFRVYPAHPAFNEGEDININAELYNEALELVNDPEVSITIKSNEGKSYDYQFSRTGQSYQLNIAALPAGEYTYTARTRLGRTPFTATGKFNILTIQAESLQSTANHTLLRNIAGATGGTFLLPRQAEQLAELIRHNEHIKIIEHADQQYTEAIELKWILALILLLLSAEWILRKREGEI